MTFHGFVSVKQFFWGALGHGPSKKNVFIHRRLTSGILGMNDLGEIPKIWELLRAIETHHANRI